MSLASECSLKARMADLSEATGWVEACCRQWNLSLAEGLRLTLIVEELFTNTVVHGHGGDSDSMVRIGLRAEPAGIVLDYADTAPAFDPLAHVAALAAEIEGDIEHRPIGRLGLTLVVNMAASVRYALEDGWNRLQLTLQRDPAPP